VNKKKPSITSILKNKPIYSILERMGPMNAIRLFVQTTLVACLLLDVLGMTGGNVQAATSSDKSSIIQEPAESFPTDRIIIKYKQSNEAFSNPEQLDQMERLSQAAGVPLQYFREMSGDGHVLQLQERLPLEQVRLLAQQLMNLPEVEYAEADEIMRHTLVPNDPQYTNQWHYFESWGINLPAAWDTTTGSSSIVAAVIDTGITNHADLSGRSVSGYDFISNIAMANDGNGRDNNPSDPGDWVTANECFPGSSASNSSWHGTHVAGTIGAASNNGLGVAGVNWNSKILPVRVLGKCGGSISDIADAMRWSAGLTVSGVPANVNPAKVLNLSLGGSGTCAATYQNAINDVTTAGAVVVISAGNSNANASGFQPANCSGVITVAATNRSGSKAFYSNFGSTVEISAPGGETNVTASNGVRSTLNTGTTVPASDSYAYYQGTSMAAPHVTGVVSLVFSRNPSLTPGQVLSILQSTAKAFPGGGTCNTSNCGSGIVDAGAAVNAAVPTFPLTVSNTGTGTGTVTSNPAGIDCGPDCSETYTSGTPVTLTATADLDSTFNGWSGGDCSGTGNCVVTMNVATSVIANFDLISPGGTIFNDSFESDDCTLSPWSSCIHDNFDLNFNFPSLVATGNQSMNILIDDNNAIYVTSDHPNAETRYIASFYFDPNSIPMVNGDVHTIFGGYSGTSTLVLRLQFRRSSNLYQVQAALLNDGSSFTTSSWITISDAPQQIALDWKAATGAGANNGSLTLSIDGTQKANLTDVDNDTRRIDRARLGAVAGIDTGTRGTYYFDNFESSRGDVPPPAGTLTVTKSGNGSGTVTGNPAGINCGSDCSESYQSGTPIELTAAADPGSTFNGWSGGVCFGTNSVCEFIITADTTVNADFTDTENPADLIIQSITAVPASPAINQPVDFSVVIKNQGSADAIDFWVDLFIDTPFPPYCSGASPVAQHIPSLAAGATQTLTLNYAGFSSEGVYPVNGIVDTNCNVNESNENNNTKSINVTVVGTPPSLIFKDGFESCDLSAWSPNVIDGGDLSAGAPGLVGSCSMRALLDDSNAIYVTSDHPDAETHYIASFYFDPNSIPMVNGDIHTIFGGYSGTSTLVLRMQFRRSSGLYQVQAALLHDNSTWNTSSWFTITDAPHQIAFDWRAATAAGANNGGLSLWIDGVQKADKTAADNDTWRIDRAQLGAVAGIDTGTRGTYYFDEFDSSRGGSQPTATLTVTKSGNGSGTVTSDTPGINCGLTCSFSFNTGTVVTLTAIPDPGSAFNGWSGGGCSGTGNCVVTMNAAASITANFDLDTGDVIFANSFEDDDCFNTQWSTCVHDAGDLQFNDPVPPVVLKDNASMVITVDDNNPVFVSYNHTQPEPRYRARFYFHPSLTFMANGDLNRIFYGYSGTSKVVVRVEFRKSSSIYQLRAGLLTDGSSWVNSPWVNIAQNVSHYVELDWRAATGAGANNGALTLWIDGGVNGNAQNPQANLTGVDNDTLRITSIRLGAVNGIDTGTRGTYYFDAFESRRQNYIGP
jgi:serine protease